MRVPTMWLGDKQGLGSACAYAQSDQNLCLSLEYSLSVKLLTEHHLEFLSLKGGCTGSSESSLVKMPHFWKLHVTAHIMLTRLDLITEGKRTVQSSKLIPQHISTGTLHPSYSRVCCCQGGSDGQYKLTNYLPFG